MPARAVPQSRRASTLGGVGAGHRLRGGSGRSNVLCLISRARLRDLRVLGTQFTSALILSHRHASVLLEAAAAHLQCSDRAAGSELTLRSHPKHRRLPRRLRKRCVGSLSRAELSHSCDVPHRGARACAAGPRSAVCGDAERGPGGGSGRSQGRDVCPHPACTSPGRGEAVGGPWG